MGIKYILASIVIVPLLLLNNNCFAQQLPCKTKRVLIFFDGLEKNPPNILVADDKGNVFPFAKKDDSSYGFDFDKEINSFSPSIPGNDYFTRVDTAYFTRDEKGCYYYIDATLEKKLDWIVTTFAKNKAEVNIPITCVELKKQGTTGARYEKVYPQYTALNFSFIIGPEFQPFEMKISFDDDTKKTKSVPLDSQANKIKYKGRGNSLGANVLMTSVLNTITVDEFKFSITEPVK